MPSGCLGHVSMQGLGPWHRRSLQSLNERRKYSLVLQGCAAAVQHPAAIPRRWGCITHCKRLQRVQQQRSPCKGIFGERQHSRRPLRAVQTTDVATQSLEADGDPAGASSSSSNNGHVYGISISDLQRLAEAQPQDVFKGAVSSAGNLAKLLDSSLERGIGTGSASMQQRRSQLGSNRLPERQQVTRIFHAAAWSCSSFPACEAHKQAHGLGVWPTVVLACHWALHDAACPAAC